MAAGRGRLYSIVYRSVATAEQSPLERVELLRRSRAKNRALGITGMLLVEGGRFLQEIEGPERAVRELMATIVKDPRHERVHVLLEEWPSERRFPDWSMGEGFVEETASVPPVLFTEVMLAVRDELAEAPTPLARLVEWFRARPVLAAG